MRMSTSCDVLEQDKDVVGQTMDQRLVCEAGGRHGSLSL
jgi:hypothetical protein